MIQKPKGTLDVLPENTPIWQYIESTVRSMCADFGFSEIRFPVFESTELFVRGVGDTTDIVQKEMFTFTDRDERSLTLRPEGTAGVARSVIENGLYNGALPLSLYYIASCYRCEKPQEGRSREFVQFGIEVLGTKTPAADVTAISIAAELFRRLGVADKIRLEINSIGCPECRAVYHAALKDYLKENFETLCPTCKERFGRNPMRILDCKNEECAQLVKSAPRTLEYLCDPCGEHMESVKALLDALEIKYIVNPSIVRGLDYYTKTVFEFVSDSIGAQGTVCGGGRYDGLTESIGGPALPGIGFGMGITRLISVMEKAGVAIPEPRKPKLYIAPMGAAAGIKAACIVSALRKQGICALTDLAGRSLKAQMKYADKQGAEYVAIIGDNELAENKVQMRCMANSEQTQVELDKVVEFLLGR